MKEYGTKTFGELNAERYDAFYEDAMAAETHDSVEMLAELAGDGKVLELAIGTGRVALPLAARGLSLHGIEASEAMVSKLREKPGGSAIPVEIGDMAEVRVKDTFDLIYLVFNTIFNLTTQEAQVRCFHNAARHLSAKGVFVVETVVPDFSEYVDGQDRCLPTHRDQRRRHADGPAFHALCLALRTRPYGTIGRSGAPRTLGVVGPLSIHR
jgi:SAM-dependent methyltransferase